MTIPPNPSQGADTAARSATRQGLNWARAQAFAAHERQVYQGRNPHSQQLAQTAQQHLLFGVPLHWMTDWGTPFALHVAHAQGSTVTDVDGHVLADFCLGDTGAMFGHSPPAVTQAVQQQMARGTTTMLATEDAGAVGAALAQRFGLSHWQFALSATDANRYVVRWLRAVGAAEGRTKLLVFNGCYHGTIEDVFVDLVNGQATQRSSLLGQVHDLLEHTVVVEFNDLPALEAALAPGNVACVLAEPAMTNIGMVLPDPGYWREAQALIHHHGALLVLDETHTISTGPSGYSGTHGLQADALVLGKPVGGGVPCAVYGFSAEVAYRVEQAKRHAPAGHSGIGTTLSGNMLTMAAMRATLSHVMTPGAYAHMIGHAQVLAQGLLALMEHHRLPWCVTQVGARTEFQFGPTPPRNGTQAAALLDSELEHLIHLGLLNRGVLITPFHNMLLVCPSTTLGQIQQLLDALDQVLAQLR